MQFLGLLRFKARRKAVGALIIVAMYLIIGFTITNASENPDPGGDGDRLDESGGAKLNSFPRFSNGTLLSP